MMPAVHLSSVSCSTEYTERRQYWLQQHTSPRATAASAEVDRRCTHSRSPCPVALRAQALTQEQAASELRERETWQPSKVMTPRAGCPPAAGRRAAPPPGPGGAHGVPGGGIHKSNKQATLTHLGAQHALTSGQWRGRKSQHWLLVTPTLQSPLTKEHSSRLDTESTQQIMSTCSLLGWWTCWVGERQRQ